MTATIPCQLTRHTLYCVYVIFLVLLTAGGWWQRQPAGAGTITVLTMAERSCPLATQPVQRPTIADGASALDRLVFHLLADGIAVQLERSDRHCSEGLTKTRARTVGRSMPASAND